MKYASISVLLISIICCQIMFAQTTQTEQQRIERLIGLAKVWGTVKFFHPFLASREIDWDKALVDAIPKVNAAKNSQEYAAAIDSMLAALGDKNTRARVVGEKPPSSNQTAALENKEPVRLENGVLLIDAFAVGKAIAAANNRRAEFFTKTNQLIPQAKTIVIDLRSAGESDEITPYYMEDYLQSAVAAMLDKNVPLASLRYRMHNGYAPQTGGTSGGYYSALTTNAPNVLSGGNKSKTPPLIFLAGESSPAQMLSGLQAAKLAFVIQDGETGEEAGTPTHTIKLSENVEVKMRTAELVGADGSTGFAADLIAPKGEAMTAAQRVLAENKFVSNRVATAQTFAAQISQKDKTYPEMEFPAAEYRLLALFRFWTVMNYFFPYKHLTDKPWGDVLPGYIPKFEVNKDAADYQTTVREMISEAQDSHVGVRGTAKFAERLGTFYPPFIVKYIENQTVVYHVFDEKSGIKLGDSILTVDGEPMAKHRAKLAAYQAASTAQALERNLNQQVLRGQKDSVARFTVRGSDGATRNVEAARTMSATDEKRQKILFAERATPVVQILPSGFGYVDLDRLTVAEVDKMFETIKETPAVIFDMRGYPNGTAWAIAPRLTEKKSPVAARFSRPILSAMTLSNSDYSDGSNFTFGQRLPERKGEVYTGKVVMLIDENAQSQSEHTALFFETATNVTFIGTPTAGANGDVTNLVLPGNLVVFFSGHDVRHADGRQLQRIGIEPTIRVAPTIRGMINGRDEILEAAIKFLQTENK